MSSRFDDDDDTDDDDEDDEDAGVFVVFFADERGVGAGDTSRERVNSTTNACRTALTTTATTTMTTTTTTTTVLYASTAHGRLQSNLPFYFSSQPTGEFD
jgi:hypothetical protein